MKQILSSIVTGFLVRADGWGGSKLFNAWSCAILFAVMFALFGTPIATAISTGVAFYVWRAPGFDGWENWLHMYWRGFWTSLIGFTLLSCVTHNQPLYGLLSFPFAAIYMLIYSGGYKWLPEKIYGLDVHVFIEHASGWIFALFVNLILMY